MLKILIEREQKIERAFESLESGEYPNATQAAAANGISPKTFQNRLNGRPSLFERPATNRTFDEVKKSIYVQSSKCSGLWLMLSFCGPALGF